MTPEGWQELPLGEVATLQRGYDLPVQDRLIGPIPIVASNGPVGSHAVAQVKGPGVVTGRSGTIGKVFYYAMDFWPLNTTLYVSEFHGNCPKFIVRLLESVRLERFVAATGVPSLNRNFVHPVPVLVPPISEQRKIAAVLSSVDDTIEATHAVIDQLQVVKKAMMAELLTRGLPGRHTRFKQTEIGEVPEGWEVLPIKEIGRVVTGGTPSTADASLWGEGYPFVTPGDIKSPRVVDGTNRSVTFRGLEKSREIPAGAVLVTCIGSTIGKVGMAAERCCTNQQINSVVCSGLVVSECVYYLLVAAKPRILAMASSTAVPIINKGLFECIQVAVPPFQEQRIIANALVAVDDASEAHVGEIEALRELKSALLSVLLTGELRVTPDQDPL